MEVPLLKLWIHHAVMEGIVNAFVDPRELDICDRCGIRPGNIMKASRKSNGQCFYF